MKYWGLCKRNLIESLRDPITLVLGLGLPLFLLVLFSVINLSVDVPIDMFQISVLTPGVAVFSFSMLMMSEANLISSDRQTSFFARLQTLPLRTKDFMLAYAIPFLIIGVGQYIVTIIIAFCFGLSWTPHVFTSFLLLFPMAVIFIMLGMMMGFSLNTNQVVGIGNVIVILVAMLSGAWMPIDLIGGILGKIANALPFLNAVSAARELLNAVLFKWSHVWIILGYTVITVAASLWVTTSRLKSK
jgi:ABC-2 type transporter.